LLNEPNIWWEIILRHTFSFWPFEAETVEEEICVLVWSLDLEPRPLLEPELPLPRPDFFLFASTLFFVSKLVCLPSVTTWYSDSYSVGMETATTPNWDRVPLLTIVEVIKILVTEDGNYIVFRSKPSTSNLSDALPYFQWDTAILLLL